MGGRNDDDRGMFSQLVDLCDKMNTLDGMQNEDGLIATELDKGLGEFFCKNIVQPFRERMKECESQRGSKTYIFPCKDINHYLSLVNDADRFYSEVVDKLCQHRYKTGHKPSCKGSNKYRLCGFRGNPRKTIMPGGKKEVLPVRLVQCVDCKQRFSILPSCLPREKHYGMDI